MSEWTNEEKLSQLKYHLSKEALRDIHNASDDTYMHGKGREEWPGDWGHIYWRFSSVAKLEKWENPV